MKSAESKTLEEHLRDDPEAWVIAVDQLQSGNPHAFAHLIRQRIPQPPWVAELLADWISGAVKLPPRKRGPALDIHPVDKLRLQARFTELRLSGMSESRAIDTLHHETGFGVSTLRKYIEADTKQHAKQISRFRRKP